MRISRRSGVIIALIILIAVSAIAYLLWPRRPKTAMAQFAPASAVVFLEITDVPNLLTGLTSTTAWRQLAPVLGLSSQLSYLGDVGAFAAATGMGSQEAVMLARSQVGVVVTTIEVREDKIVPRFALLIKTHSAPDQVAATASRRITALARSAFKMEPLVNTADYANQKVTTYTGSSPERQITAAVIGDLIIVGNNVAAVYGCIDATLRRAPSLAENETLRRTRPTLDHNSVVFGFASASGLSRLMQAGAFAVAGARVSGLDSAVSEVATGLLAGLSYSATFEDGLVVDRYLLALNPDVLATIRPQFQPGGARLEALKLLPPDADLTLADIKQPAQTLQALLTAISARVGVVTSAILGEGLRQLIGKEFGLNLDRSLGAALGTEFGVIHWPGPSEAANLIEVTDPAILARTALPHYLRGSEKHPQLVKTENYRGIDFFTGGDRAGVFLGRFMVVGHPTQIKTLIDTWIANNGVANDLKIRAMLDRRPAGTLMMSYEPNQAEVAELMLSVATLARASDGDPARLKQPVVRQAIDSIPPLVSFTNLQELGFYTETRSALGRFMLAQIILSGA